MRSIISCNVLIYITIYFKFPKPITITIVPTVNNHAGVSAKRDAIDPIFFKSFELAFYGGILCNII